MQKFILPVIDLRLFDGAAALPSQEGGSPQPDAGTLPKADSSASGHSRRSRSGDISNTLYGKQSAAAKTDAPDAGEAMGAGKAHKSDGDAADSLDRRRKHFEELISGDYKDLYAEKFQSAFNRRFKEYKGMEAALESHKPILDMLFQRYGIGDGDTAKLLHAIERDDVYYEDAAKRAGLSVEQFKAMESLRRESEELKAMKAREQGQLMARRQLSAWQSEAQQLRELYPGFDLAAEARSREFLGLLKANIPMKQAYELVHMEEIKAAAAKTAAQTAGVQLAAKIKSNASRPLENGTGAQSAAIVKNDASMLSRADRAEIARRVQRGEKIRF